MWGYTQDPNSIGEAQTWTNRYPDPYGDIVETDIVFNSQIGWDTIFSFF